MAKQWISAAVFTILGAGNLAHAQAVGTTQDTTQGNNDTMQDEDTSPDVTPDSLPDTTRNTPPSVNTPPEMTYGPLYPPQGTMGDTYASSSSKARSLRPIRNAVELTLGAGYAQTFGDMGGQRPSFSDVNHAGGSLQFGVGYRLIPQLTIAAYGAGAMFSKGSQVDSSTRLYSSMAGFLVEYHAMPGGHEFDPWVSVGTGWHGYWMRSNAGTTSLQGWEIARLQVGVDYRYDRGVAVGPVIGADLTTFFTEKTPDPGQFSSIGSPGVNTTLFAGIQGRFDIKTESEPAAEMARR